MSLTFTCPHCKHKALVDDSFIGQSGECAVCGKPITVEQDPQDTLAPRVAKQTSGGSGALLALLITLAGMGMLIALVVGLVMLSIPATQLAQSTAKQQACGANLARIGQALLDYHDDHGSFPPAYIAAADGTRRHSWRVLLLPYLGENALYQQYDMSTAWDQPANPWMMQTLTMPKIYHCPDDQFSDEFNETSYLAVTGPGTAFDGAKTTSLTDITDGAENTILLVEVAAASQKWMEPKDLDRQTLTLALNAGAGREIGSYHTAGGAHAVMADGSVRWLDNRTSAQMLNALLTIAGDDTVEE